MPCRSPGEIRSQLPRRRGGRHRRTVIRGLSASTNRQIARFERSRGLDPGEVALAFHRWQLRSRRPRGAAGDGVHEYPDTPTDHVHTLLEHAALALRTRARRDLRAAVEPLDDHVLSRTVNDPFAPADLPWWYRRIGI
jgi:hypothetical protein